MTIPSGTAGSIRATQSDAPLILESPAQRRYEYFVPNVEMTVEHPSGGVNHYKVTTRYISARDLVVFQRGFLHKGSRCKLVLATVEGGERIMVAGLVTACAYSEAGNHEIIIQFDQAIDPRNFVASLANIRLETHNSVNPQELSGSVLLVDDDEAMCRLVAHHLRSTMVDLTAVTSLSDAANCLKQRTFNLVMCDLHVGGGNPVQAVQTIRRAGHDGEILAMVGAMAANTTNDATGLGVAACLRKPYSTDDLFRAMGKHLCAEESDDLVHSLLREQQEMRSLISWYVQRSRTIIADLANAVRQNDRTQAREVAQVFFETASGYGYPTLAEAAARLIVALDAGANIEPTVVTQRLRQIESIVRRIR